MDTENGLLPDDLATGQQIDDYLIGEPLSQGSHTMTWSATQLSVQREVTICNLYGQHRSDPEVTEAFMADVRKKATIDHPLIGSILEAVQKTEFLSRRSGYLTDSVGRGDHKGIGLE